MKRTRNLGGKAAIAYNEAKALDVLKEAGASGVSVKRDSVRVSLHHYPDDPETYVSLDADGKEAQLTEADFLKLVAHMQERRI
jgi:hypothetical protein